MVALNEIDFRYINAEFIMTNGCNLCCEYCFERSRVSEGRKIEHLPFETICGYMDLILKNRQDRKIGTGVASWINFFGGEPMLDWPIIKKVIEKYKSYNFFRYSIITNGTLVTEDILREMRGAPILWQISLDSAIPEGNIYRFGHRSPKLTQQVLGVIKQIVDFGYETPIVSSTITDKSVSHILETYHYFAENRIPIKWQCILERLGDQSLIIDEYNKQNLQILDLLVENPYNIPMLWDNIIQCFRQIKKGRTVGYMKALTEAPSPNNLYIVAPNGKIYLSTNYVNVIDTEGIYSSIGELPNGIDIEKIKNHPALQDLSTDLGDCVNCPSFAINPCCVEKQFFVYPTQFKGNCNVFLSTTYYALEFLRRRGELA